MELSWEAEKIKDPSHFLPLAQITFHVYLNTNDVAPVVVEPWVYLGQ